MALALLAASIIKKMIEACWMLSKEWPSEMQCLVAVVTVDGCGVRHGSARGLLAVAMLRKLAA